MTGSAAGRGPLASVIIPTWNGERYIGQTLASVFAQTFRDFEIVVVDDGSTDGTRAVLEPYFDRLRYVFQDNAGPSAARNHGARIARGTYLAFLDHDDCWEPSYLERTLSYLLSHPEVALVATDVRLMDAAGTPTLRTVVKRTPGEAYTTRSLLEGDVGTIHNPVIRREAFLAAGGYDASIRGPEDCALWLSLSRAIEMRNVPEPLLLYRSHEDNFSKQFLDNARQWLVVLDKFERENPEFVREHVALLRRNRAKHHLRLGRELLVEAGRDRGRLREARQALGRAIRLRPLRLQAWLYAGLAWLPGAAPLYARWRRWELRRRERMYHGRLPAWLSSLHRRRGARRRRESGAS